MKVNLYLIFLALSAIAIAGANIIFNESTIVIDQLGEPELPEQAYSYDLPDFPEHLLEDPAYFMDTFNMQTLINDEVATLGRVLFYDTKLSPNFDFSCGTCHIQEFSFADGKDFSQGVNEPTKRNSLHLNDNVWFNTGGQFWDASVFTLDELIPVPLMDDNEVGANLPVIIERLSNTPYYSELFENAYGDDEITKERMVTAIAQFIRSMHTFDSKLDKSFEGTVSLTSSEVRGKQLFEQHCKFCHGNAAQAFIFELGFFNNGLPEDEDDKGMGEWAGQGMDNLFRPPVLRNISFTGPYMHDGRFETLEEVINHYSEGVEPNEWNFIQPPGFLFNSQEKQDLIDFLRTMDADELVTHPKWSDPFKNTTPTTDIDLLGLDIAITPNPASELLTFNVDCSEGTYPIVTLFAMDGRIIHEEKVEAGQNEWAITHVPSGSYLLRLNKNGRFITKKLIIN